MVLRRPHVHASVKRATERRAFHVGVVCLVLLDISVIVTSIILELTYPHCGKAVDDWIERMHLTAAGNGQGAHEEAAQPRFIKLLRESNSTAQGPPPAAVVLSTESLDPPHAVRDALVALRWISVGILSLFCVELSVVALAKGPLRFLRSPLDVLDVLVVACSLVFEIVLHGIAESVAGLLVVLRMWRVLYIMHEVMVAMHEGAEEREKGLKQEVGALRRRVADLESGCVGASPGEEPPLQLRAQAAGRGCEKKKDDGSGAATGAD